MGKLVTNVFLKKTNRPRLKKNFRMTWTTSNTHGNFRIDLPYKLRPNQGVVSVGLDRPNPEVAPATSNKHGKRLEGS